MHLLGPNRDWHALRTWNGTSSLKTWLNVVAAHLCMTALRKTKTSIRLNLLSDWNETTEPARDRDVGMSAVLRAIEQLPNKRQRLVILLSCVDGLSDQEIADQMSTSPNNVKTLKSRAKAELLALLEEGMDNVQVIY